MFLTHAEQSNPTEISEVVDTLSKPTVRKSNSSVGKGRVKKRRLPAERQQKDITGQIGPETEIPALKGG